MTSIKRSTTLSLACGALLALALGSVALATHARPGGGSPFRVPLVVAYNQCGGTPTTEDPAPMTVTDTHVTPLDEPSCDHAFPGNSPAQKRFGANPPTLTMTTTGTGIGTVRLDVQCMPPAPPSESPPCVTTTGENLDIVISGSGLTGVNCVIAGSGLNGACPAIGAGYHGLLLAQSLIRITDHSNAPGIPSTCGNAGGVSPCVTGTVEDLTFIVPFVCGAPASLPGGTCGPAASTINTLKAETVKERQRGNVEVKNVRVMSPGNDFSYGSTTEPFDGTGDEDKYLSQGIFIP